MGKHFPLKVKSVDAEAWLRGLTLANPTKSKIRNQLHCVFSRAEQHELFDRSPITNQEPDHRLEEVSRTTHQTQGCPNWTGFVICPKS